MSKTHPNIQTSYPWSMSATEDWSNESGLDVLASFARGDRSADEIAEWLWKPEAFVQNSAIIELLDHDNVRQAATLVRTIIKAHPVCVRTLKETFGKLIDDFTSKSLDRFPSQPSEYPKHVTIRMIQ